MKPLPLALAAAALGVSLVAPKLAQARDVPTCVPITTAQVDALFDRWNKTLATKNPDSVVANYAPDATLLPTVENGPLVGPAAIRGYFVSFLKKSPHGAIDQRIVHIGCNIAYDVGTYTFTLDGEQPDSHGTVHARYTFVYAPSHGTWLIVHHHSSAMPEPAR
jgi:uncharacterized protein (TIGR02246 family)